MTTVCRRLSAQASRRSRGARPERRRVARPDAADPFAVDVGEELRAFRFLHAEPEKLRASSERAAPRLLAPDGSNLPTALAALAPEVRAAIRADMASVLRSFRSFEVVPTGDELGVEVELTDDQKLPARVLSDGTLRLLALFTLLWSSRGGAAIAVEEVENGIHPTGLRALVVQLVAATQPDGAVPPQVLLSRRRRSSRRCTSGPRRSSSPT